MRTLLIDNHDSFTHNLFQLLAEVNDVEPILVRNDELTWEQIVALEWDNVVLSPGPGQPGRARDFGVCAEAIRRCEAPILGVCLGHQGIGLHNRARVVPAPRPMHGRVVPVAHSGSGLFAGIPTSFEAVRYHSLCLARPLPAQLEEIAWSEDGVLMALANRRRRQWGVQFHPESVAAEHGRRLLENFRDLSFGGGRPHLRPARPPKRPRGAGRAPSVELRHRRLDRRYEPERAFAALYGESPRAFWLDSARVAGGARFSFIGDASGPLASTAFYDVGERQVTVERSSGREEVRPETILEYLDRELGEIGRLESDLPFDFQCGFAGYIGYEVKADCGGADAHRSSVPDSAFILADRIIAFDLEAGTAYLVCLVSTFAAAQAEEWFDRTTDALDATRGKSRPDPAPTAAVAEVRFELRRAAGDYLGDIAACQEKLRQGESYEICLTNSVFAACDVDPLAVYGELRRLNPAPFAAFLRFDDLAVLSSSPERLVRVDRRREAESQPIKGTAGRSPDWGEDMRLAQALQHDPKSRSENLMIADLVRNDLGSVCEIGSVRVPSLMEVESYETMHQLVTTVRGTLRKERSVVDCVRACFPPGSMTGAPKQRTMEILDELEGAPRGVYSGAIGFLGLSDTCDLSVAIRTIVIRDGVAEIGAGGAIVAESVPEDELAELLLKAEATRRAITAAAGNRRYPCPRAVPLSHTAPASQYPTTLTDRER